jgi:hypothetical protein
MKSFYHFDEFANPKQWPDDNQTCASKLLSENSFHFHVSLVYSLPQGLTSLKKHYPNKPAGPYYCKAIPQLIAKPFSDCNTSIRTKFPNYFNPMPLPTIALIITVVRNLRILVGIDIDKITYRYSFPSSNGVVASNLMKTLPLPTITAFMRFTIISSLNTKSKA